MAPWWQLATPPSRIKYFPSAINPREKKGMNQFRSARVYRLASHHLFYAFASTYIVVFSSTVFIHRRVTAPVRQSYGPAPHFSEKYGRRLVRNDSSKSGFESVEDKTTTLSMDRESRSLEETVDGQTITSILCGESAFPTDKKTKRLRFQPGKLNITQPEVLRHCYANPAVYKLHYPSSDRQVTSVSDYYKLIHLMIPKSGSSTGRWVMNNVLEGKDSGMDPAGDQLTSPPYGDYDVIIFVRDPLSRFYSQYDEIYLRYGPWMARRKGKAWQFAKNIELPYKYLYENMTDWEDYQDSFCPPSRIPKSVEDQHKWCTRQPTQENGTLARRFERFVDDYDGLTAWDLHLHLQVPHISNKHTGRPRRVDEIYSTSTSISDWKSIVEWYGQTMPENGEFNARSIPRRFNTSLVSIETKRRICRLSAIDYCCLNMELPPECGNEEGGVYCSLDKNKLGEFRIQPWAHPHEV